MGRDIPQHVFVKDKVFLVTGGAGGIGAAIVRLLLEENAAHVAFLDIAEQKGTELEKELATKFGALKAKFINCDISDEKQLATAYNNVLDKYRRLDVVINNAAVLITDEHLHKRMIDINFSATVNSTLKAMEVMSVEKGGVGGAIVNLSSLLALEHSSHLPVYAATKAAVLQFSNSMGTADYYSKTQVRVMAVCLGPTDTAILHRDSLKNFESGCTQCLTSRSTERQKVSSAATGIVDVMSKGESGSTWLVANDKPAYSITDIVTDGFDTMTKRINGLIKK